MGASAVALSGSALLAYQGLGPLASATSAALGALAIAFFALMRHGRLPDGRAVFYDAIVLGLYGMATNPAIGVWAAPLGWLDLLRMSPIGVTFAVALYLVVAMVAVTTRRGSLSPAERWFLLAVPVSANLLLLLTAKPLLESLGRHVCFFTSPEPLLAVFIARCLVLALFNELTVVGIGLLMDRRWAKDPLFHCLLVASAAFAIATPAIADKASDATTAALAAPFVLGKILAATMLAQTGLWAQTYLVTGVIMDALRGRRPSLQLALGHWRDGAVKAAIYGGCFILFVHGLGLGFGSAAFRAVLERFPLAVSAVSGALLFPVAKTIVESFDGSRPFFERLAASVRDHSGYLRGFIVGGGLAVALQYQLAAAGPLERFAGGFLIGGAAYAGADLLSDAGSIWRRVRRRFQMPRVYALGTALGGLVGGSLAWYFDPLQIAMVGNKLESYLSVFYPAAGLPVSNYVIYPLFSKWGAIDLGSVAGGVRLFFSESLSGVINWSLAAPLFGVNLVALTALVQRSTSPIRALLTREGIVGVVEQTFRVQRWGLWMAPVIYSFLRLAPEPTWYNQDGAVRTLAAIASSVALEPAEFRNWSLEVFLGLLAYDWLRVVIWFDHMGLRVATLVNASFVVGDVLDEKAAKFIGHSMTARSIPEGIRRFATWGPLLIPFYIPRQADWDYVWSRAGVVTAQAEALSPPVANVVLAYALFACASTMLALGFSLRRRANGRSVATSHVTPATPASASSRSERFVLSNGVYTLELRGDGRGFSRAVSQAQHGRELDVTKRPEDPSPLRGKFFYLRELGDIDDVAGKIWSAADEPTRQTAIDYRVTRPSPDSILIENEHQGIRVETRVEVAPGEAVELWSLQLVNLESRNRRVEVTSYRELAISDRDAYERHPSYHALHIGTCFVRSLGAIIAVNRKLDSGLVPTGKSRKNRDAVFHAVRNDDDGPVRLVGYEDSRALFLGSGSLRKPEALESFDMRAVEDEGLAYTFDPAACLQVHVDLPAHGSVKVLFVDGYANSEHAAARVIASYIGGSVTDEDALEAALATTRITLERQRLDAATPPYAFSADGTELSLDWDTPRPWSHVLANELSHGAVLANDGSIFSFAGNSQQNALTPFIPDSIPAQDLGQALYVVDEGTGRAETATYAPFRRKQQEHGVVFGRGYAIFRKALDDTDIELTVFVPPSEPIEVHVLRLSNRGRRAKRYRIVAYFEIVLAEISRDSRANIIESIDAELHAMFFRNPKNEFQRGYAFVASSFAWDTHETSRSRFLGADGRDLTNAHFVEHACSDRSQPDDGTTIAAFSGGIEVPPGGEICVAVLIGQTATIEEARELATRYRDAKTALTTLASTRAWWDNTLTVLRIRTTSPDFDRLVNDWLPYQVLTARLWGRVGPDQRSGGFGYRDQLQDVMPLAALAPSLARRQILLHASQQFLYGDVLQWWHAAPNGKTGLGARNHSSDPHLWLVHVVDHYVRATGDHPILDEEVAYLEGPRVARSRGGLVFAPRESRDRDTVYNHCRRSIERALARRGRNGLPLMERGDWNDGFDVLGAKGRGESVWLGFFLYDALSRFAQIARERADIASAERYAVEASDLRGALDRMWRGDKYLRAISDDGDELCINSALMAAWPILSGATDFERGRIGLETILGVLEKEHAILLMDPPATEASRPYPGKIAEYPPGVRENGGQYSHGVSWLVDACMSLADLAEAQKAPDLARRFRDKAFAVWSKISPLDKMSLEAIDTYGLPPHQQAADIYFGGGYSGRGGWSWYTGAAARMLSAAYALLGIRVENGEVSCAPHAGDPKGSLRLLRVVHRDRVVFGRG